MAVCRRFEQDLDNCEIDAAFDQPGGVAVTKAMERGPADAGLVCGEGEGAAERPASDGPIAGLVGKSHRGFLWVVQNLRRSFRTAWGKGTIRSLLPLPMIRSRRLMPSIAAISRVVASPARRPQA